MGSNRGQEQQQDVTPQESSAVDTQQSMFGDMMKAQADRRQQQIAMRKARVGYFADNPMGFMGQQFGQQAGGFQGLLQALAQMQAQQQMQQQQPQQQQNPFDNYQGTG